MSEPWQHLDLFAQGEALALHRTSLGKSERSAAVIEIVERDWQPVRAVANRLIALTPTTRRR